MQSSWTHSLIRLREKKQSFQSTHTHKIQMLQHQFWYFALFKAIAILKFELTSFNPFLWQEEPKDLRDHHFERFPFFRSDSKLIYFRQISPKRKWFWFLLMNLRIFPNGTIRCKALRSRKVFPYQIKHFMGFLVIVSPFEINVWLQSYPLAIQRVTLMQVLAQ